MARATWRTLVWALVAYIVTAGDSVASASPGDEGEGSPAPPATSTSTSDPRDVVFPDASAARECCVPPRDYGSRTSFVPAMLRSVENL